MYFLIVCICQTMAPKQPIVYNVIYDVLWAQDIGLIHIKWEINGEITNFAICNKCDTIMITKQMCFNTPQFQTRDLYLTSDPDPNDEGDDHDLVYLPLCQLSRRLRLKRLHQRHLPPWRILNICLNTWINDLYLTILYLTAKRNWTKTFVSYRKEN